MPCVPFNHGGARGFLCTTRQPKRCACGARATLECDWKVERRGKPATCDKPLCARCTHVPAPGKDLCPAHRDEWEARQGG